MRVIFLLLVLSFCALPSTGQSTVIHAGFTSAGGVRAQDGAGVFVSMGSSLHIEPLGPGPGNQPPDAQDDMLTIPFNTPQSVFVLQNDSDPEGDPMTVVTITKAPQYGIASINPDGQSIEFIPLHDYSGDDEFEYRVDDDKGGQATATVHVTVLPQETVVGLVRFRVDMNREMRLGNLGPGTVVHVSGTVPPLSDGSAEMTDGDSDGVFEAEVTFDLPLQHMIEYTFSLGLPGALQSEPTGSRTLAYSGAATLPVVFWNNVSGVANEPTAEVPVEFGLSSVYPNPFNPTAVIDYGIERSAPVRIDLVDVYGRLVRRLLDRVVPAGVHRITLDASELPSGTYLVVMQSGTSRSARTVSLVR